RAWARVGDVGAAAQPAGAQAAERELARAVNHARKEVTDDLEGFRFNTAIAELMTLLNTMIKVKASGSVSAAAWSSACRAYLLMLAPLTPHIAEELWERLGNTGSIHLQPWPAFDEAALVQDTVQLAVQVNGKVRGQVTVPADADQVTIVAAARADHNVARHIAGQTVVREIVVPGRLVSFVVKA